MNRSWWVLLAMSLTACGSLSEGDFVNEFASAYCSKIQGCYPDAFDQAYPSGQTQCIASFTHDLTSQQLQSKTTCPSAQVDSCMSDIAALQCGRGVADTPVPDSCSCP